MNETPFINTRPLARRSPLAISVLLHAGLISLMAFSQTDPLAVDSVHSTHRSHSVILLRLRDLPYRAKNSGGGQQLQREAGTGAGAQGSSANSRFAPVRLSPETSVASADPGAPIERKHGDFQLTASLPPQKVKQTLLQFDIPPDIVLKQDVPLPNIVFWTAVKPPPFRKQFVAPPLKELPKRVAQNLPPALELELPNREPDVSVLKLSSALVSNTPHLARPPATTAPVRMPSPELSNQVPEIVIPDSNLAQAAALIALVDSPAKINGILIVPPANQAGNSGASGASSGAESGRNGDARGTEGQGIGGSSAGTGKSGSLGKGSGSGAGDLASNGYAGSGTGGGAAGTNGGAGNQGAGGLSGTGSGGASGSSGVGTAAGAGTGGNGSGDGLDVNARTVTRINLPKDGKFGVVVMGSSQAVPYPESVGALGGKMVYTVYLNVGLRKKWVLQYCLTKEAERSVARGTAATPLEAPFPFLIFRPDRLVESGDYVIVHGLINKEGSFDQLAMVFPDQFDQKDLLINSLKLWAFRPATRDRVAAPVEILLIIPGES